MPMTCVAPRLNRLPSTNSPSASKLAKINGGGMNTRGLSLLVTGWALLEIDLVVMRGRDDHFHPLAEQRAEAGPRLHDRVPVLGLLVAAPVERAEVIDHRQMRGGGEVRE